MIETEIIRAAELEVVSPGEGLPPYEFLVPEVAPIQGDLNEPRLPPDSPAESPVSPSGFPPKSTRKHTEWHDIEDSPVASVSSEQVRVDTWREFHSELPHMQPGAWRLRDPPLQVERPATESDFHLSPRGSYAARVRRRRQLCSSTAAEG